MKVNEEDRTPAPHQTIRGHGRIDAARQQAGHTHTCLRREATSPGLLPEETEGAVRQHVDVARQRGAAVSKGNEQGTLEHGTYSQQTRALLRESRWQWRALLALLSD